MYRGPGDKSPKRSPSMSASVFCHPPLSQSTSIAHGDNDVSFTAVLEHELKGRFVWEVAVWHNWQAPDLWEELHLQPDETSPETFRGKSTTARKSLLFRGTLNGRPNRIEPVRFTLKYRSRSEEDWQWANKDDSIRDGELIYQTRLPTSDQLNDYIAGLGPELSIRREASESPRTKLWTVLVNANPAHDPHSGITESTIGIPREVSRWMALVRLWSPWLAPEHGRDKFSPSRPSVLSSFLRKDGLHLVLLAVSGIDDMLSVFNADAEGSVVCQIKNDSPSKNKAHVVISVGESFDCAVAAAMYHSRKMVIAEKNLHGGPSKDEIAVNEAPVNATWMENWQDGLSYCTWNGLGQQLTEEAIFNALTSLQKNNVNITNLIIDDNWQSLDNEGQSQFRQGWVEFEANKKGFPNGLKHAVSRIRKEHKNIQHIAVWHAIMGYWGGIAPKGKLAAEYRTKEVQMRTGNPFGRPPGGKLHVIRGDDVGRYYEDFYQFLDDCGVDSVKTDCQFFLDEVVDADDRRELTKAYQDAWSISSLRHFSVKVISYFFPEIEASHPYHIFCNAHNALFTQHLNVLPDWDMFQTSHTWSSFHGAARCLSGGPVYITDVPGEHDIDLIHQMTAATTHGTTAIIRPPIFGRTIHQYNSYDASILLKIGTFASTRRHCPSFLGIFNISPDRNQELIPLKDFPGVAAEQTYIVRAHTTGQLSNKLRQPDLFVIDLPVRGWEILTAYPLENSGSDKSPDVAVLGLLGRMTGAAAMTFTEIHFETSGRLRISLSLKTLGILGIYISDLPSRDIDDDILVTIQGKVVPRETVRKSDKVGSVLELDIERAWHQMDINAGWSNEVFVEVLISC
ncbi:MAG: hypothetical protein M1825_005200 [Sarcosagium campestre]|nr:MAG: hypothetical protein M1825_005200 [Sarcosagium campestre]